jgi:7-keto-8-aminopelargonate synthetase-like enzyme
VLNLCANNYLGLANHPCLREAAHAAIARFGVGPTAVRSIVGTLSLHTELELKLAAFKGVEATLTLQSGFAADLFPSSLGALRVRTDGLCRSLACAVQRLCEGSCT